MADLRQDANKAAAEHLERTRKKLEDGRASLERMQGELEENRRHIAGISRWIEQTERHLGELRRRRTPDQEDRR